MGSRTWIKVYCDRWLEGTLREESPEIRGVWIDLLTLAGAGRYGDSGEIKLSGGIGLTDRQISEILHISLRLWKHAKLRFYNTDRIEVTKSGAILIKNWSKYQSEYDRQKPHRQGSRIRRLPRPEEYEPTPDYPDLSDDLECSRQKPYDRASKGRNPSYLPKQYTPSPNDDL